MRSIFGPTGTHTTSANSDTKSKFKKPPPAVVARVPRALDPDALGAETTQGEWEWFRFIFSRMIGSDRIVQVERMVIRRTAAIVMVCTVSLEKLIGVWECNPLKTDRWAILRSHTRNCKFRYVTKYLLTGTQIDQITLLSLGSVFGPF